ncbi:MAG: hypothetical protein WAM82_12850, partial [Thermoanaerobaculia bacterium]
RLRRYQQIEPDAQGRLLSETTELLFGVSAKGDRIEVFNARTGERLESPAEMEIARKAAEERATREAKRATRETTARKVAQEQAAREAKRATREEAARKAAEERATGAETARKAAEEELARLRAQIEQLKKSGD